MAMPLTTFSQGENAQMQEDGKTANIFKFLPFSHNYHLLNNNNPLIFIYYSLFNVQNVLFYPISHLSTLCTVQHAVGTSAQCCLRLHKNVYETENRDGWMEECVRERAKIFVMTKKESGKSNRTNGT